MDTQLFTIDEAIPCHCIRAASFPDGVLAAHQSLHRLFPYTPARRYYGISRARGKEIEYRAAAEQLPGDTSEASLESFTIPAGRYAGTVIRDFRKDMTAFSRSFQQLLTHPELDPNGFCLEWYYNMDDVRCMVKLNDKS